MEPLVVGMYGCGTVGGGVYQLLQQLSESPRLARPIVVKTICVRTLNQPRDVMIDRSQTTFTTDPHAILRDDSIQCVVEVMGGTGLAKTVVLDALRANKAVVTANKALLAENMDEIISLSSKASAVLAFEAAVCGGIPIIQLLQACYAGDGVQAITGICNGTTNYMLCQMEQGADYAAALKEAQDLGYAEADPTADVEGHDVRAKIAILAKLAFGCTIADPARDIPCTGISNIAAVDFDFCKQHQATIRLTGNAKKVENPTGSTDSQSVLSVFVTPVMISQTHFLASAYGSDNVVAVTSHNMGRCVYRGPGAGRFPTANSVVADLVRVANHTTVTPAFPSSAANFDLQSDYAAPCFYIRIPSTTGSTDLAAVTAAAHEALVPIALLQTIVDKQLQNHVCVLTGPCQQSLVADLCNKMRAQDEKGCQPLFMPFLKE